MVTDLDDVPVSSENSGGATNCGESSSSSNTRDTLPGDPTCDNTGCPPVPSTSASAHHTHSPFTASTHPLMKPEYIKSGDRSLGVSRGLGERVWQDVVQCHPNTTHPSQSEGGGLATDGALTPAELAGQWDFADPATKLPCTCSK